ncbi:MAG: sensor domain-containing diguanylate cyclase [Candidatus Thiodiazotropha endolucinida]|nr:sensor domain-containing diguanylate cyclase [Candidatus Thiodiazotropha taylori]MCG8092787.1 sensor domain-containing diguanylate cyclase [Candidatus Thiodiazotropha endolucinida]MCG8058633.1 sensor domain-containing diguanylate cyclase [Candidatus Thiodiazotropha taylori]MCG8064511.1 sensor domain-containing diguanylate cyclase [Candidatus Thiodiazotropha taylori]MCW4330599.1 sensor domain-containing diguanylate cyclase [Candidatus Thiodiazotropha endolucinida]
MSIPVPPVESGGEVEENGFSEHKELILSFLMLFIPASLLLASIFYAFSTQTEKYELQTTLIREEAALNSASELTSLLFEQKLSDLMVLAEGEVLRSYIHDPSLKNWVRVAREFSLFARRKPKYFQLRYIDNSGMEVIRINSDDNVQEIVPQSEMQNKADRYYFKEAMKLALGEIYISPLDLNVERGVIEQPVKPTVRFATPVSDGYGGKRGIVIINYTPNELLQRIADNFETLRGDAVMLNSQGHWLQGVPEEQLWGFMYGRDETFATQKPDVWSAVTSSEKGSFFTDDGVYIFKRAYPLVRNRLGTLENVDESIVPSPNRAEKRYWIFLSHISNNLIEDLTAKRMIVATITYLLLFLVAGVISVLFAKNSVQKKQAFRKLQQYATTDDLTGLANRRELDKVALREFKRATRFTRHLSVLMLDLDHFKSINDTYGHNIGDSVLRHVADICVGSIRGQDFMARYGGEEFTILLPETDIENGSKLAQRICDKIAAMPYQEGQQLISITVSVGASEIEDGDIDFNDLLNRADKALYEAKKRGRNQVVISTAGEFISRLAVVNE